MSKVTLARLVWRDGKIFSAPQLIEHTAKGAANILKGKQCQGERPLFIKQSDLPNFKDKFHEDILKTIKVVKEKPEEVKKEEATRVEVKEEEVKEPEKKDTVEKKKLVTEVDATKIEEKKTVKKKTKKSK